MIKVKLKNLTALLAKQNWTAIKGQSGWEQCAFQYRCGGWSRSRQFVAVRMKQPKQVTGPQSELWDTTEYDYFCYVTTEPLTPWKAHKKLGAPSYLMKYLGLLSPNIHSHTERIG